MLDFLMISTRSPKRGLIEVYPNFIIKRSSDLMIRGGDFYAIWVEERGQWSTDEQDALALIDAELRAFASDLQKKTDDRVKTLYMWDSESGMIDRWHGYCQRQLRDSFHMLDETLIFANTQTTKKDYSSKRLPYSIEPGPTPGWDKLLSTLYSESERHKIEWAIGSIVSGASKKLQKFMVLYGAMGTGKSTVLNVVEQLFEGYFSVFDAKALGSASNAFALEAFKTNPLVAIQHDGDLSRIEDNTRLNSLVSHESMVINEKFKSSYSNSFKCFLFMGTNKPVKITDAKSGLIRRLIDVTPTGDKLPAKEYRMAVKQVSFELGAIAARCQDIFLADPNYYDDYIPIAMLGASNDFYNFMADSYPVFKKQDGTTMKAAWEMYKTYCEEAKVPYSMPQRAFREELRNYFREYSERFSTEDGNRVRSYYSGFRTEKFEDRGVAYNPPAQKEQTNELLFGRPLEQIASIFDRQAADYPAQYASKNETPCRSWDEVTTRLRDLDTSKLHYVKVPENHIVIDFDLKNSNGEKDLLRNISEASKWPATYAELSKSGKGVHLHYIYIGDPSKLSRIYDENIEVKVFSGKSSLRRMLTRCNDLPIASINSGLPLKGEKPVISYDGVKSERALRTIIIRNLNKEYHADTRSSIDFINKTLEDAYNSGLHYDASDLRNAVLAFSANSTNQSAYCIKLVNKMHFKSDDPSDPVINDEVPIAFFDCEVFPNLFLVNWKLAGKEHPVVRMINPSAKDIEGLIRYRLIGFNNRDYDNHMIYACLLGYTVPQLYHLSQRIIVKKDRNAKFGEAYNLSYTDIYDFAAKKQSLKKWEIELGIHHQELGLPWDQPVPEERWEEVAEYCDNDVLATEALFYHLKGDWTARQILAAIAGMTVNDTTNSLTTRIIFGKERHPHLVYTDLATGQSTDPEYQRKDIINAFPGYEYKDGKNMYRGTDVGKGGYVYAEPGMYSNIALLDVASMHPNSAVNLGAFGMYTQHFKDILDIRIAIKHKDYDTARKLFGGRLAPYLDDENTAKDLAQALKIAINSVYGLTSASFDNPFRDPRNVNNIVALRGALFMRTLQDEVQRRGFVVAHIKTDSIKIPDATPEIIQFVMDFGKQYGYTFEHEATYDRMCLVNNAVYIAKYATSDWCEKAYGYVPGDIYKHGGEWTATGTQFQVPYVFKTLFSKEPIEFADLCETKSVTSALYLDMNEDLPDVSEYEKEYDKLWKQINDPKRIGESMTDECDRIEELHRLIEQGHHRVFIGRVGQFCPIKPGCGGGILVREADDPKTGGKKYNSATGADGWRWLESEKVKILGKEDDIDRSYYNRLVDEAIYGRGSGKSRIPGISDFGDFEWFVSGEGTPPFDASNEHTPPWSDSDPPWDENTPFDVR